MRQVSSTQAHTRSYDDPITLEMGDAVQITKRDLWGDAHVWVWCINAVGKAGWVPATYLNMNDAATNGIALRDYNAIELTITAGASLTLHHSESGWAWVENSAGQQGWVPLSCFE